MATAMPTGRRTSRGLTALHVAAAAGIVDKLEELLDLPDAEINDQNNDDGVTPLHLAVQNRRLDAIDFLLKNGASSKSADNKRETPWSLAYKSENDDIKKVNATVRQTMLRNHITN
jgi:ankyrin repeat protein